MDKTRKVAIITGGAQGIGRCMAARFAEAGYAVMIADLDEEAGREAEAEYSANGTVKFQPCDVASETDVQALVRAALKEFNGIDVLINNAGIGVWKPIEELTLQQWNRVLNTNLTGAFLCAKYCGLHLKERGGRIINICSTRALQSEANTESYSASKGGLLALTHALAVSMGPEVTVNCISPGWIEVGDWKKESLRSKADHSPADHAQHPAGRVGVPDDIAELALYLASDKSGFITGANFVVDGGMTRKMIYVE
jgi:NAD(P)-dependent dehydrogenase (short-subunit alcohol dehydrogenase family)